MEQDKNTYFPFYINMKDKKILIYGAGKIAKRRILMLADFEADLVIRALEKKEELPEWIRVSPKIQYEEHGYVQGEIDEADIVFAATNNKEVNELIYLECRQKNIPVNNASNQKQCDFFFPAVIREDQMVIGVTSGGKNHKKTKCFTDELRKWVKEEFHADC